MKSILVIFLILIQLALQVGIPIHKHFCEMDGTFASVVLKIDHECAQTHEHQKDCCSDELQVVKTNFDQAYSSFEWRSVHSEVSLIQPRSNFIFFKALREVQILDRGLQYRPPPLYRNGKHIQTLHQTWQI